MLQRKVILSLILVFTVITAFSAVNLAQAQSSAAFDFGCWGVTTSSGGEQQTASYRLTYAVGEVAGGVMESANARVRIGYSQDWRTIRPAPPAPGPVPPAGAVTVYLPIVSRYVYITRTCSW